jgi:hypothetical protein
MRHGSAEAMMALALWPVVSPRNIRYGGGQVRRDGKLSAFGGHRLVPHPCSVPCRSAYIPSGITRQRFSINAQLFCNPLTVVQCRSRLKKSDKVLRLSRQLQSCRDSVVKGCRLRGGATSILNRARCPSFCGFRWLSRSTLGRCHD